MFNREVELTLERDQMILSTRDRLKGIFDLFDCKITNTRELRDFILVLFVNIPITTTDRDLNEILWPPDLSLRPAGNPCGAQVIPSRPQAISPEANLTRNPRNPYIINCLSCLLAFISIYCFCYLLFAILPTT